MTNPSNSKESRTMGAACEAFLISRDQATMSFRAGMEQSIGWHRAKRKLEAERAREEWLERVVKDIDPES